MEGETIGTKKDSKDKKIPTIDNDGKNEGSKDENDVKNVDEFEKEVGVEEKAEMGRNSTPSAEEVTGQTEEDWNPMVDYFYSTNNNNCCGR